MPRVEYNKTQGLFQASGSGFALNEIESISGNTTLTQGTCVAIGQSGGTHEITLPPNAGANTGDIIFIIMNHTAGKLMHNGQCNIASDVTFNAKGDGAICIYDGSKWQVIVSNS